MQAFIPMGSETNQIAHIHVLQELFDHWMLRTQPKLVFISSAVLPLPWDTTMMSWLTIIEHRCKCAVIHSTTDPQLPRVAIKILNLCPWAAHLQNLLVPHVTAKLCQPCQPATSSKPRAGIEGARMSSMSRNNAARHQMTPSAV